MKTRHALILIALAACSSDDSAPISPDPTTAAASSAEASSSAGVGGSGGSTSSAASSSAGGTGGGGMGGVGGDGGMGGAVQGNGYVSGVRLRAKYILGGDGAKEFTGWFDSLRNEDCAFGVAEDGKKRCLPLGATFTGLAATFYDAACTQPVFGWSNTGGLCAPPVPKYYLENTPVDPCTPATRVRPVGAPTVPGPLLYQLDGSNQCAAAAPPPPGFDYFALDPAVPPTDFVEGVAMVE